MARYARTVGGNWTDNATWSTTSGGAADTVAPTASDDVFLDANSGNVTISATSVGKSLTCTGYTGTLTHNGFDLTISGSITLVSGMTYTPSGTTARLIMGASGTLTTGGKLLWVFICGGSSTCTLGDNVSMVAQKTTEFSFGASATGINLNGFTISGNSATNRVLIKTATLGTAKTITNTTGTFANADFRDITFSTNADYSAITGLSGDCGGNTNATFTTAADQHWISASGGNWSDVTKWTSRVPLPQDNVYFDNAFSASQTVTADMPRLGKSIDWTGASGNPVWNSSLDNTMYGSLTIINSSGQFGNASYFIILEGRSTHTITTNGKTWSGGITQQGPGGTYNQQDAITVSGSHRVSGGTYNSNGYSIINLTSGFGPGVSGVTATRTVNLSSSTITLSRSATGTCWDVSSATGLTLNAGTSTILISDTGANAKTFAGGGLTYNNLQITGGGAGAVIITGANTFSGTVTVGSPKTLTLPASTTTTITGGLIAVGTLGNEIQINSSSAGTAATLSSASGTISADYLIIKDSTATGGTYWFAGQNSIGGSGVSGWRFRNPDISSLQSMGNATFIKNYQAGWNLAADYSVGSGIGTFTATRASGSPGTYIDSSGVIRLASAVDNIPRFTKGFYNSTGFVSRPGLIVEGASTNLLTRSYSFNQADWNKSAEVTFSNDGTLGPDGAGETNKATVTGNNHAVYQTATVSASTSYTFSFFVKKGTMTDMKYSVYNVSGASDIVAATSYYTGLGTSWNRVSVTFTTPVGCTSIRVYPLRDSGTTGTVYFYGAQLEALPFASTFIPTTTAALTRNAETLTYPISGNRTAASETMLFKTTPFWDLANDSIQYTLTTTDTKERYIIKSSASASWRTRPNSTDNAGVQSGYTTSIAKSTSYVIGAVFQHSSPYVNAYVNGSSEATYTAGDWTSNAWGTNFNVGCATGANWNGIIESIDIFSDAKSAADVLTITNFLNFNRNVFGVGTGGGMRIAIGLMI